MLSKEIVFLNPKQSGKFAVFHENKKIEVDEESANQLGVLIFEVWRGDIKDDKFYPTEFVKILT